MSLACPSLIEALSPGLCAPIDIYCERASKAFDAEPVNAATNLAFLIGAALAFRRWRRRPVDANRILVPALILTMAAIGAGSFAFHTIATAWAAWADVIPILIFMLTYLWLVLTRFFGWKTRGSALALVLFLAATLYLEEAVPRTLLWGGAMYLPTLAALLAIGVQMRASRPAAAPAFLAAAFLFVLSFSMRTLDQRICDAFPLGTHFLWHLLNALLLYHLIGTAIKHAPATEKEPQRIR